MLIVLLACAADPKGGQDSAPEVDPTTWTCGWTGEDPEDLSSTGNEEGDVVADIDFIDQCGEEPSLYDFAGEWHILYMTAEW
jgi:cytochrome oxidase Cu insertion factor (SCO1/SenC/PrrC family)